MSIEWIKKISRVENNKTYLPYFRATPYKTIGDC